MSDPESRETEAAEEQARAEHEAKMAFFDWLDQEGEK